jgi:hypothetical protein
VAHVGEKAPLGLIGGLGGIKGGEQFGVRS